MGLDAMFALLERLADGDDHAAAEVFVEYAPYLRMVIRRQLSPRLRARFDSSDVVQSVWVDLLRGFRSGRWRFPDAARLRAFLLRVTRNRFLEDVRRHRRSLEREQPLADEGDVSPPSSQPRPSEVAQADELWQHLLDVCPPAHRELLRLKREGLPLEELAARTGLHPSSVRRILYDLAHRVTDPPADSPPNP